MPLRLAALALFVSSVIDAQSVAALGSWSPMSSGAAPCGAGVCVLLNDGRTLKTGRDAAEILDPVKGAWTPAGTIHEVRTGHTATLLQDGRVLIAGGGTRSLEIFDPKADAWTLAAGQLSAARSHHAATLLANGSVLISGGKDGDAPLSSTDLFDPASGNVTSSGFLTVPRAGHTATRLLDGKVLIAGGDGLASAEIYDPELQSFSPAGAMTAARTGHVAILLPDNNQVLLGGGRDADGEPQASAETYTPWTETFQAAAPMAAASADARLVAGKRGTAIVASEGGAEAFHFPTVTAVWNSDGAVKIDGEGWQPGEIVRLALRDGQVTAAADAEGSFQRQFSEGTSRSIAASYLTARGHVWQAQIRLKDFSTIGFAFIDLCAYLPGEQVAQCIYPHQLVFGVTVKSGVLPITPSGTVELLNNSTEILQTQTLSDGGATFTVPPPPPGNYSLTVMYTGDDIFGSSTTAPVEDLSLIQNPDTVTISSSASSVVYGQPLQLTAKLFPVHTDDNSNALEATPEGTVQFLYGNVLGTGSLGSANLQGSVYLADGSAGVATSSTSALIALNSFDNNYSLTASYSGDSNYASSVSKAVTLTISPATSGVGFSKSPNPAVYGQQVTVQFTVGASYPSAAIPQGNSSLFLNGAVVSNQTLDATGGGTKVFNILPTGTNKISLVYAGNGNVTGTTASTTVTVTPATPSITVTSSMNPSVAGQTVTFTFTVTTTIPGGATPTGLISATFNDVFPGALSLDGSGTARVSFTPTTAGIYTVNAEYSGDNNFTNIQGSLTQTVRSLCDVNGDGVFTIADVQRVLNEAMGAAKAADDLNADGHVNVTDLQIAINALMGLSCTL